MTATPFHFLPVLLLLVAIPLVSDGLHQVGMARMAGAVFTPAPGDAEEMDGALSQVSFFPPGFHPVPRRDRRLVDPSDDPDEIIFFYELIQEDLFHHPLVYNLGLELFTGLRLSHYATHGFIIGESERQPLLQYRREQEKNKKMRAASNPNIRGRSTRPPLLPPREVFPRLTRGDYLGDEGMEPPLMPLMDRYFVHQMELQLVHNRFCDIFVELMHVPHRPPLVITMFNWMVSRFGLRCVFFRTHALKTATRKFVILASQGDNAASNNFFLDEVLAHPHYNLTYLLNHPLLAHWYGINGNLGHPKFSRTPQGIRPHHISGASLIQFSSQNAWQYALKGKIECVGGWQSRAYGHEVDSRHFLELFDGLPVVVIDSVSEINKQNLILWRAQVFNKASRGEYQLEKLFSQSWIDRIYKDLVHLFVPNFCGTRSLEIEKPPCVIVCLFNFSLFFSSITPLFLFDCFCFFFKSAEYIKTFKLLRRHVVEKKLWTLSIVPRMQRVGDKKRVPALRRRAPRVLSCALVFLLLIVLTARVGHAVAGDLSAGTHSGVSAPPLDIQTAATAGDVQKLSEDVVVQTPTEINAAEVESAVISLNGSRSDESPSSEVPSDLPTSSISPSSSAEESTAEEEPTVVPSHVQNSKLDRSGTDLKEERDDVAPPKEESGTGSTKVVSEVNNAGVDTLRDRDASRGEDYPAVNGSAVLLSSSSSSSVVETEANSTPSSSLSSRSSEAPSTTASSVTPAQKGERMRSEAGIPPTAAAFSADTSPTLIPKNFEPMPSKDQRFRDDYVDPDELVYQGDINRDDLIHHPLAFNLCFNLFSGLQLNSFTTSGVIVSAEERAALREYRWRNPNRTYREEVESQKMLFNMKESGCCGLPLAEENAANVEPDIPIVQAGDDDDEAMVVDDNTASAPPPVVGSRPASPILTPHQLLERMIQGDSVDHPLSLLTITDRYFVENMDPGIFTATLCDYFVELLHIPNRPPLVVNMFNWQAARFTMRCLFYRSHALKNARRKFVVLASEGDPSACASFFLDGSLSGETHITHPKAYEHKLTAVGHDGEINYRREDLNGFLNAFKTRYERKIWSMELTVKSFLLLKSTPPTVDGYFRISLELRTSSLSISFMEKMNACVTLVGRRRTSCGFLFLLFLCVYAWIALGILAGIPTHETSAEEGNHSPGLGWRLLHTLFRRPVRSSKAPHTSVATCSTSASSAPQKPSPITDSPSTDTYIILYFIFCFDKCPEFLHLVQIPFIDIHRSITESAGRILPVVLGMLLVYIRRRVRSALPLILVGVLLYFILLIFFLPPASLGNSDDARQWTPVTHHHNEKSPATKESGPSSSSHANALPTTTSTSPLPTGEPLSSKIDANASFLHHLWPDERYRDAPPTVQDAIAAGLLEHHTMPYPPGVDDNPDMGELYHDPVEYFDLNIIVSRADFLHHPIVFAVGLESFAGLRLSALTRTSTHIGLEERYAVAEHHKKHQHQQSGVVPRELLEIGVKKKSSNLQEAVSFDHERVAPYFTDAFNRVSISYRSPPEATASVRPPPASELSGRLILGDTVYDPLALQLLDRHFPFDRFMQYNFLNHFCDRFVELMHLPNRPPLVVHLNKQQVFSFTVRCLYFRPQALTNATRKFVILGTEIDETATYDFFRDNGDLNPREYKNPNLLYLLNHPLLVHWYSTNGNIQHPKFSAIPIGMPFFYRSESWLPMDMSIQHSVQIKSSNYTSYYMHNLMFGRPDQDLRTVTAMKDWPWRQSWIEWLRREDHQDICAFAGYGQESFFQTVLRNTFVASPPGNGYECHRTYETLTLGSIPILLNPAADVPDSWDGAQLGKREEDLESIHREAGGGNSEEPKRLEPLPGRHPNGKGKRERKFVGRGLVNVGTIALLVAKENCTCVVKTKGMIISLGMKPCVFDDLCLLRRQMSVLQLFLVPFLTICFSIIIIIIIIIGGKEEENLKDWEKKKRRERGDIPTSTDTQRAIESVLVRLTDEVEGVSMCRTTFVQNLRRRPLRALLLLTFLLFVVFHVLFVVHTLNADAKEAEDHAKYLRESPPPVRHRVPSKPSTKKPSGSFDFILAHQLWPDDQNRDGPPTFEVERKNGLVKKYTMPYPETVEENPDYPEVFHDNVEDFDWTLFITRSDLMHAPVVFNIGLESFAGLRLSVLTQSSAHVGLEERRALLEYQKKLQSTEQSVSNADSTGEANSTAGSRPPFSNTAAEALEFDHDRLGHYFTYKYNHNRNVSSLSPDDATAPASFTPAADLLARMIVGDGVFDPLSLQMLDEHFVFERNMDYFFRNHFCDRFVELMHVPGRPPLVVHLHKMHVFQFLVRCLYFRPQALTTAKRKFVILATELDETAGKNFFWDVDVKPADFRGEVNILFVLNHPLLAHWYSTNGNIWHPKFTAIPIGFQFYYRSDSILPMSRDVLLQVQTKHANYTRYLYHNLNLTEMFWGDRPLHDNLHFGAITCMWLERALIVFSGRSKNRVLTGFTIWPWRWPWFNWMKDTGIGHIPEAGQEGFYALSSDYAFVVSPPGKGYECYRTWEAMAFGAIPIIQNPTAMKLILHMVGGKEELESGPEVDPRALLEPYLTRIQMSDLVVERLIQLEMERKMGSKGSTWFLLEAPMVSTTQKAAAQHKILECEVREWRKEKSFVFLCWLVLVVCLLLLFLVVNSGGECVVVTSLALSVHLFFLLELFLIFFCYAKSARASCSKCKKAIAKHEVRIGTEIQLPGGDDVLASWTWRHLCCFTDRQIKNAEASNAFDNIDGIDTLAPCDKALVEEMKQGKLIDKTELIGRIGDIKNSNMPPPEPKGKRQRAASADGPSPSTKKAPAAKRGKKAPVTPSIPPDDGTEDFEVEIVSADTPVCPYGESCFQTQAHHYKEFRHGDVKDTAMTSGRRNGGLVIHSSHGMRFTCVHSLTIDKKKLKKRLFLSIHRKKNDIIIFLKFYSLLNSFMMEEGDNFLLILVLYFNFLCEGERILGFSSPQVLPVSPSVWHQIPLYLTPMLEHSRDYCGFFYCRDRHQDEPEPMRFRLVVSKLDTLLVFDTPFSPTWSEIDPFKIIGFTLDETTVMMRLKAEFRKKEKWKKGKRRCMHLLERQASSDDTKARSEHRSLRTSHTKEGSPEVPDWVLDMMNSLENRLTSLESSVDQLPMNSASLPPPPPMPMLDDFPSTWGHHSPTSFEKLGEIGETLLRQGESFVKKLCSTATLRPAPISVLDAYSWLPYVYKKSQIEVNDFLFHILFPNAPQLSENCVAPASALRNMILAASLTPSIWIHSASLLRYHALHVYYTLHTHLQVAPFSRFLSSMEWANFVAFPSVEHHAQIFLQSFLVSRGGDVSPSSHSVLGTTAQNPDPSSVYSLIERGAKENGETEIKRVLLTPHRPP
eukprot:gene5781-4132_t